MSKKDNQHIVPRTYLKRWRISDDQNFVYAIDISNKYNKGVQKIGLNDRLFTRRRYYNDPSFQNAYIIEDVLGEDIEPLYGLIMQEIELEKDISLSTRENIIQWLYVSKMRSPNIRDNAKDLISKILNTIERYRKAQVDETTKQFIKEYSTTLSKQLQLSAFSDEKQTEKLLTLFVETLAVKHWKILKSKPSFEFWTNDNPGFSPNTHDRFAEDSPYHSVMEMNSASMIFFPLSPKYCLEISPFQQGTPLDICGLTMNIKFEEASISDVMFINKGVFYTCCNLIISNNKEMLERCIVSK